MKKEEIQAAEVTMVVATTEKVEVEEMNQILSPNRNLNLNRSQSLVLILE
jgi:hypothetical protein